MYRWNWFTLCAVISFIKTCGSVGVSAPRIKILPSQEHNPHWQTTFTLKCQVPDWPGSPVFFWKRDGSTLYPYADNKIVFSVGKQSIIFNDVTQQQSGTYLCIAAELREYIFESSSPVQITVEEPPLIPLKLAVNNKTSTSLQLLWEPQGSITADYYSVLQRPGDIEFTAVDEPALVISELNPYSVYTFTVAAYNSVGSRGKSIALQTRTEPGPPAGVLSFNIGLRTSSSIQMLWSTPSTGVNDILTGYSLMVHATNQNQLVIAFNFTTNTTDTVVSDLESETEYTFSMAFLTRCCTSNYGSKDAMTMSEGRTMSPTDEPRTEGNTALVTLSNGAIVGVSVGCVMFLILVLLGILLYYRCRSPPSHTPSPPPHKPHTTWNDGTGNGTSAMAPISPPPEYSRAQQPSEAASSNVQNVSISRSFCYDPIPSTSPPPAYHSRTSSNNDNSSISDLSNVDATEQEVKEVNVPLAPSNSVVAPSNSECNSAPSNCEYNGARQGPPRDTWI